MKVPSLSIIIPCYNGEKWIEPCIQSILIQSYTDYEIIIVNDGSTDNSLDILNNIAKIDERVHIVDIQNGGVSSARNAGLLRANGQWITFVDIDDTLPPNSLSTMMQLADDGCDIVFAGYNHAAVGKDKYSNCPEGKRLSNIELAFELFKPTDFPYLGYPWAKLFRRAVIELHNVRFDEAVKYNEDRLFSFEFLSHARGGAYTTKPVYNYIQRGDSAMAKIEGPDFWKFETDLDAFVKMCRLVNVFKDKELERLVRVGALASCNRNITLNRRYGNDSTETNRRLRKKLRSVVPISFIARFRLAALKGALCYKFKKFFK